MVAVIFFWLVFAILVGVYASSKGRSGVGFFFIAVLLSPLIAFIIALVARPIRANTEARAVDSGEYKKCPYCAELVKAEAIVCKHCGRDLPEVNLVVAKSEQAQSLDETVGLQIRQGSATYDTYRQIIEYHGGRITRGVLMDMSFTVSMKGESQKIHGLEDLRNWVLSKGWVV